MGCVLPAELLSRNRERNRCPGLSPVGRLEQEGVLALLAHCPTKGAGNKVEQGDLLEARAGSKLYPLQPTIAGSIEGRSIGCPSVLPIRKVCSNRSEWEGRCTHPGLPAVLRRIDVRGQPSPCDRIRKNDGKDAVCAREKGGRAECELS
jgi:hypothetical protein